MMSTFNFPKIELFDWLKRLPAGFIDLGNSGLSDPQRLSDLGIDLPDPPLGGNNFYGYEPLKALIADQVGVTVGNIVITPGASMANFALLAALTEPGDQVMIESPCYQPFVRVAESLTGRPPTFLCRIPDQGYHLDADSEMLTRTKPKVLVVSNLHNPTGTIDPQNTLIALANRLETWGGYLLVDEVFLPFIDGGESTTSGVTSDNIVAVCSLTKVWGLGSLRIGWAICSAKIARPIELVMDHMHVNQPFICEHIAFKLLENPEVNHRLLNFARNRAKENLPQVETFVQATPELDWARPAAGIMAWMRFVDGRRSTRFCRRLLDEFNTLVMPGHYFGDETAFRLGFGADRIELSRGLHNITTLLDTPDV